MLYLEPLLSISVLLLYDFVSSDCDIYFLFVCQMLNLLACDFTFMQLVILSDQSNCDETQAHTMIIEADINYRYIINSNHDN